MCSYDTDLACVDQVVRPCVSQKYHSGNGTERQPSSSSKPTYFSVSFFFLALLSCSTVVTTIFEENPVAIPVAYRTEY